MKKKKISVLGIVLIVLGVGVCIAASFLAQKIFGELSVFNNNPTNNRIIDTLYHKIPAIIRTIEIITIAYLLNFIIRFCLSKLFAHNKRGKTIVNLLASFIKYLIAIIAILMVLSAFGVDTRTLLASAGILGLIIGLGAQSLIADIIAGVFIVFEGDFEVGDIVVIDDWRGTVEEIGIRTTKIIDWQGNIKIVNNSHINTIINQSKELSVAASSISIEYGQSIPAVEEIIMHNLERVKNNIPEIIEGPFYKGVNALAESSVDLLFVAKCKEEDIYGVQRAMNREFKIIFDENNINIPFPQVTISQLEPNNDNIKVQHDKVEAFVKEQRESSKGVEENK